jgi:RNA polymerase sigma-70 factor (ECF subfamily)
MVGRELIERCRRHEPGAFEELVDRTHRQVYTLAVRLVGDRHEAEDVAQDAYLRVHRSLRGFRGDARFETWLYRIVANAAMNHLRKRRRFGEPAAEPELLARPEPQAGPGDSPSHDEVHDALAILPVGQRAVVVLKDVYGFTCEEIGEQMGVSTGAVKLRLHRARRRLKEHLYGVAAEERHEGVKERLASYVEEHRG